MAILSKVPTYLSILSTGIFLCLALSCGSGSFVDSNVNGRSAALAEGEKIDAVTDIERAESEQDSEEDIVAEVPAVISGAHLSCQYSYTETNLPGSEVACRLENKHLEGVDLKPGRTIEIGGKTIEVEKVWEEKGSTLFTLKVEEDTIAELEKVVEDLDSSPTVDDSVDKPLPSPLEPNENEVSDEDNDLAEEKQEVEPSPNFTAPNQLSLKLIKNQMAQLQLTGGSDSGRDVSYEIVTQAVSGTITEFNASTGALSYTPLLDFVGIDSFTFVIKDEMFSSQEFTFEFVVLESLMLSDDFERLNPLEGPWVQSQTWVDGLKIYDRQTQEQSSLFLFGNGDNTNFDNIQIISEFNDFTDFSTAKMSASYLLQDVGDDSSGAFLPQETMNIKICIKSSAAECGIDPKNESLLNDPSIWLTVYTPPQSELNDGERDCRDLNWLNLDFDLNFDDTEGNYQDFSRSKVSVMLEAANMQAGMAIVGDLDANCNDVVIFDQVRFEGTSLNP